MFFHTLFFSNFSFFFRRHRFRSIVAPYSYATTVEGGQYNTPAASPGYTNYNTPAASEGNNQPSYVPGSGTSYGNGNQPSAAPPGTTYWNGNQPSASPTPGYGTSHSNGNQPTYSNGNQPSASPPGYGTTYSSQHYNGNTPASQNYNGYNSPSSSPLNWGSPQTGVQATYYVNNGDYYCCYYTITRKSFQYFELLTIFVLTIALSPKTGITTNSALLGKTFVLEPYTQVKTLLFGLLLL